MIVKQLSAFTLLLTVASVAAVPDGSKKDVMMTSWGEKVTAENAWREYPRPQLVRENWTNLNGYWDYTVTSNAALPKDC